jgi:hypothetical protein
MWLNTKQPLILRNYACGAIQPPVEIYYTIDNMAVMLYLPFNYMSVFFVWFEITFLLR